MSRITSLFFLCIAVSLSLLPQASAQTDTSTGPSAQEIRFARQLAQENAYQLRLSRIALVRTTNATLRDLARQIIADHLVIESDLRTFASLNDLNLPRTPTAQQITSLNNLRRLTGTTFDRRYLNLLIRSHSNDIDTLDAQASLATDADVSNLLIDTSLLEQNHLALAAQTAQALGFTVNGIDLAAASISNGVFETSPVTGTVTDTTTTGTSVSGTTNFVTGGDASTATNVTGGSQHCYRST